MYTHNCCLLQSVSYCVWSDRLATATFAGEVTVAAIPTTFYHRHIHKLQLSRVQKVGIN